MPPKKRKGVAATPATGTSTPLGSGIPGTPLPLLDATESPAPGTSSTPATLLPPAPSLAETLSYLHEPRPFKNPYYHKNVNRRARNVKNVLNGEREKVRGERERLRACLEYEGRVREGREKAGEDGQDEIDLAELGPPPPEMSEAERRAVEEDTSYTSTEAAPSVLPNPHYCDITGLEGPYTEPKTKLRYHDKSVYEIIKGLNISTARDYLAVRGAAPIVK